MTDDMEDPVTRETMALEYMEGWWAYSPDFSPPPTMDEVRQMLQVLDSFDPLRAIMGEVANELEHILNWVPLGDKARTLRIRDLFVKIRNLTTDGV